MDEELKKQLEEQRVKIDAMYKSLEKIRKYFQILVWITVAVVILPMLGLVFAIPAFMTNYVDQLSGLGL